MPKESPHRLHNTRSNLAAAILLEMHDAANRDQRYASRRSASARGEITSRWITSFHSALLNLTPRDPGVRVRSISHLILRQGPFVSHRDGKLLRVLRQRIPKLLDQPQLLLGGKSIDLGGKCHVHERELKDHPGRIKSSDGSIEQRGLGWMWAFEMICGRCSLTSLSRSWTAVPSASIRAIRGKTTRPVARIFCGSSCFSWPARLGKPAPCRPIQKEPPAAITRTFAAPTARLTCRSLGPR